MRVLLLLIALVTVGARSTRLTRLVMRANLPPNESPFVGIFDVGSSGTRFNVYGAGAPCLPQSCKADAFGPIVDIIVASLSTSSTLSKADEDRLGAIFSTVRPNSTCLINIMTVCSEAIVPATVALKNIPVYFLATAGLRVSLNNLKEREKHQPVIFDAVKKQFCLAAYQKETCDMVAMTTSGVAEGFIGFVAMAKVAPTLGFDPLHTVYFEIGGASQQIVFRVPPAAYTFPAMVFIEQKSAGPMKFNFGNLPGMDKLVGDKGTIYSQSFLGSAFDRLLHHLWLSKIPDTITANTTVTSDCLPRDAVLQVVAGPATVVCTHFSSNDALNDKEMKKQPAVCNYLTAHYRHLMAQGSFATRTLVLTGASTSTVGTCETEITHVLEAVHDERATASTFDARFKLANQHIIAADKLIRTDKTDKTFDTLVINSHPLFSAVSGGTEAKINSLRIKTFPVRKPGDPIFHFESEQCTTLKSASNEKVSLHTATVCLAVGAINVQLKLLLKDLPDITNIKIIGDGIEVADGAASVATSVLQAKGLQDLCHMSSPNMFTKGNIVKLQYGADEDAAINVVAGCA